MFCMGQDQSKGVELEDKVVEIQYYGITRTTKVPQIYINVVLRSEEFEMFRCSASAKRDGLPKRPAS